MCIGTCDAIHIKKLILQLCGGKRYIIHLRSPLQKSTLRRQRVFDKYVLKVPKSSCHFLEGILALRRTYTVNGAEVDLLPGLNPSLPAAEKGSLSNHYTLKFDTNDGALGEFSTILEV
ncbi:hypothetical protein TNCV_3358611 [Trichonephila clavipes]|nr:hypothetical protein TNCV_3358611 [Trichonephila clavipes]